MTTQNPDPYGIDGLEGEEQPGAEVFAPQASVDDRARPTRMESMVVDHGRLCARCGYDLTGLPVGGNCPECGETVLSKAPTLATDAIRSMPKAYLAMLAGALFSMMLLGIGLIALLVYGLGSSNQIIPSSSRAFTLYQIVSLAWFACVVFICLPPQVHEPNQGIGRRKPELWLAVATVASQAMFLLSAFHVLIFPNAAVRWISWPALISFLGMSLVAMQLSNVAWRLNDEDRGHRLTSAALSLPAGYVMSLFFGWLISLHLPALRFFGLPFLFLQILGYILQAGAFLYVLWSLWSLGQEAVWAIRNLETADARTERMKQRAKENFEQAQRERDANRPFGGPLP